VWITADELGGGAVRIGDRTLNTRCDSVDIASLDGGESAARSHSEARDRSGFPSRVHEEEDQSADPDVRSLEGERAVGTDNDGSAGSRRGADDGRNSVLDEWTKATSRYPVDHCSRIAEVEHLTGDAAHRPADRHDEIDGLEIWR
jgi:hypothetical protein